MTQTIYQVDSFTSKPFTGNPAGVCVLPEERDERWMQNVATEMNLSETAFLVRARDGYNLRWFTPAVEVELCGHATLASAHILWETGALRPDEQARFHTLSGLLTADRRGDWYEMDFPVKSETAGAVPASLVETLGANVQVQNIVANQFDFLVEVTSESIVRAMQPDFTRLSKISVRGVIVTSRSDSRDYDFVSRFFAPAVGVNEDPVTGSAHCFLSPYWSERLGRNELVGYQASARGGVVKVRLDGDRVHLGGQAVTVLRGELI
ncbi:MAG TPA: PhzF family phenazine biosynthesis protein [Ktedonobacteraceae bacterium]